MSSTKSPRLSVQWIHAAKAAHFHVSLNTLRPGLLGLPFLLALGIVILVMEFNNETLDAASYRTGPCSAVGIESDCRSRGHKFDPGLVPYFRGV